MLNSIVKYYLDGAQILHKNLYLFWINLAYIVPITHIIPTNQQFPHWVIISTPFMMITLKLADTALLYTQPQTFKKIAETYVITVYRYFFRIVGIMLLTGFITTTIFILNQGDLAAAAARIAESASVDATLWQRLALYLPGMIFAPLIPFLKIFWVVQKQSFFRSIFSGIKYAFSHLAFALSLPLISLCLLILQYPINYYFHQPNLLIFTVLNVYVGLVMTSASIAYFKSHKVER